MARIAYRTEGTAALKQDRNTSYASLRLVETTEYERAQAAQHPRQRLHSNYFTHEIGVEDLMLSASGVRIGRNSHESKLLIAIGAAASALMFGAMVLFSLL